MNPKALTDQTWHPMNRRDHDLGNPRLHFLAHDMSRPREWIMERFGERVREFYQPSWTPAFGWTWQFITTDEAYEILNGENK